MFNALARNAQNKPTPRQQIIVATKEANGILPRQSLAISAQFCVNLQPKSWLQIQHFQNPNGLNAWDAHPAYQIYHIKI